MGHGDETFLSISIDINDVLTCEQLALALMGAQEDFIDWLQKTKWVKDEFDSKQLPKIRMVFPVDLGNRTFLLNQVGKNLLDALSATAYLYEVDIHSLGLQYSSSHDDTQLHIQAVVMRLCKNPYLELLNVNYHELTDIFAEYFSKHGRVKGISIRYNALTAQGIILIMANPYLKKLAFDGCGFNYVFPEPKWLVIDSMPLAFANEYPVGFLKGAITAGLCQALESNTTLEEIVLGYEEEDEDEPCGKMIIGADGLSQIEAALKINHSLQRFEIISPLLELTDEPEARFVTVACTELSMVGKQQVNLRYKFIEFREDEHAVFEPKIINEQRVPADINGKKLPAYQQLQSYMLRNRDIKRIHESARQRMHNKLGLAYRHGLFSDIGIALQSAIEIEPKREHQVDTSDNSLYI